MTEKQLRTELANKIAVWHRAIVADSGHYDLAEALMPIIRLAMLDVHDAACDSCGCLKERQVALKPFGVKADRCPRGRELAQGGER